MFSFVTKAVGAGVFFFALVSFWPVLKKDHSGYAKIIDAGVIEINGERHDFYGLRALALNRPVIVATA